MNNKVVNILTSHDTPKKVCAMGNEAVARGALEAGVNGIFSYPGTPSTEISEIYNQISEFQTKPGNKELYPSLCVEPVYFEYSINEKIALEKAIAYSISNLKALCIMKNVGMNVASDPLMSITYQTIAAPLVIVVCDDPGCHSSSNEQDSRYWGQMASVPVFNPATPDQALRMTRDAFSLSDKLKLPVIVRTTTRVSHTRGIVKQGVISYEAAVPSFEKVPEHINIPARTATAHRKLIDKLHSEHIQPFIAEYSLVSKPAKAKMAVIASGVSVAYLQEILSRTDWAKEIAVLNLGIIYPFPEKEVAKFINGGYEKILVLEELEPIIENAVRIVAQRRGITTEIFGKGFSSILRTGEFSLDIVMEAFSTFSGISFADSMPTPLEGIEEVTSALPPRPPALCAGCPHRATFYALKLCIPREQSELVMCGDIGCFGLGALPPLKMIDTINHMGMSVSMAQGLSEAFHTSVGGRKTVAMLGDGTFFHSGVASLMNAVYTKANILVIIFDNRTIGMTGGQDHPGASKRKQKYNEIQIEPLVKGMGIPVEMISPFDLKDTFHKLNRAMNVEGVSVVISQAPCIFLPDFTESQTRRKIVVDKDKCNTCANHSDLAISCSRKSSPKISLVRARAKIEATSSINAEHQACPANICNHGFFNAILEGDHLSAIDIVRDKMLFARTCGDICHRPCELFAREIRDKVVPIKQLKNYVTSADEHGLDFTRIKTKVSNAEAKGKTVAIVGAGPAGLSAAYDLVQEGYQLTLFDREDEVGGLVKYAIPNFRMHKADFTIEANILSDLGVEFQLGKSLGTDITIEQLQNDYDAVILAIGMGKSKELDVINKSIPAEKHSTALEFLKSFNDQTTTLKEGSTVLVIGGGNSAVDSARSAKHLDKSNHVVLVCIETRDKMPAFNEEIEYAIKKGIEVIPNSYVDTCSANGRLQIEINAFSNKKHRRTLEADHVIVAIGQDSEKEVLGKVKLDDSQRVVGDQKTGRTGMENTFVAGDLSSGNHMSVIGAIASGKQAAVGVRKLLEDYPYDYEGEAALARLNTTEPNSQLPMKVDASDKLLIEITQFNLFQSCQKCNHCIDNFGCPALVKVNGKIELDQNKCTHCGLCIDVCPNEAIGWETEKTATLS